MNRRKLVIETLDEINSVNFAIELGILKIKTGIKCDKENCHGFYSFEKGKVRHGINGRYRCNNYKCKKSFSLFKNSIFAHMHMPFHSFFNLFYSYAERKSIIETAAESHVSPSSSEEFRKKIENIISTTGKQQLIEKIGGYGETVEIDEVIFLVEKTM